MSDSNQQNRERPAPSCDDDRGIVAKVVDVVTSPVVIVSGAVAMAAITAYKFFGPGKNR